MNVRCCRFFAVGFSLLAGAACAADLRITDTANTAVVVRNAVVDYGGLLSDHETQGIRAQLGEGAVTIRWADIELLTIVPRPNAAPQVDVVLRNAQRASVILVRKGRMKLTGRTDLGDYSVDVEKIRVISPIQAPAPNAQ